MLPTFLLAAGSCCKDGTGSGPERPRFRLFLPCTHLSHLSHSAVAVLYRFIVHDFPTPSSSYANTLIFVNTSPYTPPLLVLVTLFYANPSPVVIGPYLTFRHRRVGVLTCSTRARLSSCHPTSADRPPLLSSCHPFPSDVSLAIFRHTSRLVAHQLDFMPPIGR